MKALIFISLMILSGCSEKSIQNDLQETSTPKLTSSQVVQILEGMPHVKQTDVSTQFLTELFYFSIKNEVSYTSKENLFEMEQASQILCDSNKVCEVRVKPNYKTLSGVNQ